MQLPLNLPTHLMYVEILRHIGAQSETLALGKEIKGAGNPLC